MSSSPERWAFLNVVDKTGIVDFAYALKEAGFKILSAGATLSALRQAELEAEDARTWIGGPNVLEGPLGLLHPKLLAGIAADRDNPSAMHEIERRHGVSIDLVAVNLYPLAEALAEPNVGEAEIFDYVDVAGSTILRLAARNFRHVIVLSDPGDYISAAESLKKSGAPLSLEKRKALAAKAFHYGAYYDATVAQYFSGEEMPLPEEFVVALKKTQEFAYGENPHQQGALYTLSGARPWGVNAANLVAGRALSYNHFLDLHAAWELATEIAEPSCAVVKFGIPVGFASSEKLSEAAYLAWRSDPRGASQGTAAVNRELDEDTAKILAEQFVSLVAAPQFSPKALAILKTKKDARLVTLPSTLIAAHEIDLASVAGGVLLQDRDNQVFGASTRVASRRQPTDQEMKSMRIAWHAAKFGKTHAAVVCRGGATIGIGSGQTSRLDAIRLALLKSQERHPIITGELPVVMASDGPLSAEHVLEAARAGVAAIMEPGGSADDKDAIETADERGLALVFTGLRHFRH